MNCIAVIACLGLLFGTLFESGAENSYVTSEVVTGSSSTTSASLTDVNSTTKPSQPKVTPSIPVILGGNSSSESINGSHEGSELENGTDTTTPKATDATTTENPATTTINNTTTTTIPTKPPTPNTTIAPATTTTIPTSPAPTSPPTPSTTTSTLPPIITTKASLTTEIPTTAKPSSDRRFDGPSFIGGIVFALGVTAIAFVAWKFYKARTERNYHTL